METSGEKLYVIDERSCDIPKKLVQCNSEEDLDILNVIREGSWVRFNYKEYKPVNYKVKGWHNLWVDENTKELWQICGRVVDINNDFIPNVFYVRLVGRIV